MNAAAIVEAQRRVEDARRALADATEARAWAVHEAGVEARKEAAQALGKPYDHVCRMAYDRRRPPGWSPKP